MLLMYNGIPISHAVKGPTVHTDLSLVSDEKANHILQMAYSHTWKWRGLIVTALWCCWQLWLRSVLWNYCSFYKGCLMIWIDVVYGFIKEIWYSAGLVANGTNNLSSGNNYQIFLCDHVYMHIISE